MEPLEACSHPLKLLEKVEANKHEMVTTQSLWDKEIVTKDEGNLDFDHATLSSVLEIAFIVGEV